jgi:hypothetical protein
MGLTKLSLFLLILGTISGTVAGTVSASAQSAPLDLAPPAPRVDLSVGSNHVSSKTPSGNTQDFGLGGGYLEAGYHLRNGFSLIGELTLEYANTLGQPGYNQSQLTYMGGPRLSHRTHQLLPYAQFLVGGAHESTPNPLLGSPSTSSASSWALAIGSGIDIDLTRQLAVRPVEAQFIRAAFPSGAGNEQQHLILGVGFVLNLGHLTQTPPRPYIPPQRPSEIWFHCGGSALRLNAGDKLAIIGDARTQPDLVAVDYHWKVTGGAIQGTGRLISINTAGLSPGFYRVLGQVSLISSPVTTADCVVTFQINPNAQSIAAAPNVE